MDTGMIMTPLIWIASLLLVGVGMAGILLPGLPGTPLVFCGLLLAAWVDGFEHVGAGTVIALAVLTVLGICGGLRRGGPRREGGRAGREAVIGAAAGTFVGLFFGIPGIVFGPFVGAVAGEFVARRSLGQAAARAGDLNRIDPRDRRETRAGLRDGGAICDRLYPVTNRLRLEAKDSRPARSPRDLNPGKNSADRREGARIIGTYQHRSLVAPEPGGGDLFKLPIRESRRPRMFVVPFIPQPARCSAIARVRGHECLAAMGITWAISPEALISFIPCSVPFRDGQSLILSKRRNSSTRLR